MSETEKNINMKIATYNVNSVNGRLPVLLRWLDEAKPDVVCLQELKTPQEKFPEQAIKDAGYNAIWHGQKELEWCSDSFPWYGDQRNEAGVWTVIRRTCTVVILKHLLMVW